MFPKLLKIRRVERLKLLRIRLWGCIIVLLVLVIRPQRPRSAEAQLKGSQLTEPEPVEFEQAFNGAYRSYRINGRPRMDVETLFHRIRGDLIDLIKRKLNDLNSAKVQTTTWTQGGTQ